MPGWESFFSCPLFFFLWVNVVSSLFCVLITFPVTMRKQPSNLEKDAALGLLLHSRRREDEQRSGFSCHVATILSSGFSLFILHHSARTTALRSLISCAVRAHRLFCLLFGDCYSAMSCCLVAMLWSWNWRRGSWQCIKTHLPFTIFCLEFFLMTLSLLMS